jgi:AcrR family transcriptional regulator
MAAPQVGLEEKAKQGSSRERLLDAAEELFAEAGFNGVSVRQIVERASVNLGAIPYHFGTKENLFKEVLLRRANPLRAERQRMMAELLGRKSSPTLEELLFVLLEPAFRTSRENEAFRRLLGRASMDPAPEVRRLMVEIYTLDFITVPHALRQHFSGMNETEFHWKLNCFYGVMLFVQADTGKIQTIAGEDFDTSQPAIALKYVIPFLAAGMRAKVDDAGR